MRDPHDPSPKLTLEPTMFKTPLDFSIAYHNIEGIHDPNFGCKIPSISTKLIHDVEILAETWGDCEHDHNIAGYQLVQIKPQKFTCASKGRSSGGLNIYYKTCLHKFIKKSKNTPHYMWLEFDKAIFYDFDYPLRLCVCYNPPSSSKYCNKEIYEEISSNVIKHSSRKYPTLIIGDLNSRTGNLPDYIDYDKTELPVGRELIPSKRDDK